MDMCTGVVSWRCVYRSISAFVLLWTIFAGLAGTVFAADPVEKQKDMLSALTDLRSRYGAPAYILDPRLSRAAQILAEGYATSRAAKPDTDRMRTAVRKQEYDFRSLGWMTGAGSANAEAMVKAWAGHQKNLQALTVKKTMALGVGYVPRISDPSVPGNFWLVIFSEPAAAVMPGWRTRMLDGINRVRAGYGLPPLKEDARLDRAAQEKADDMADGDYFAHQAPDGKTVADRVRMQGYNFRLILENLAAGQASVTDAVGQWMKSTKGHREALLNREIKDIGMGYTFEPFDSGKVRHGHYWALALGKAD